MPFTIFCSLYSEMSEAIARARRMALARSSSVMVTLDQEDLLFTASQGVHIAFGHAQRIQLQLFGQVHQDAAKIDRSGKTFVVVGFHVLQMTGADARAF